VKAWSSINHSILFDTTPLEYLAKREVETLRKWTLKSQAIKNARAFLENPFKGCRLILMKSVN